jgi:hypothetical protein
MKTLIVNGSPRKKGYTSRLVARLSELLEGEKTVIETYRSKVSPCIECRYCWTHDKCALDTRCRHTTGDRRGGQHRAGLAHPLRGADGLPAQWASRLQLFWVSKYIRKAEALREKSASAR